MLKWSETDLTEFFGVVATVNDDTLSHDFEISHHGLRLLVTIFDFEEAVYVSIFRDGLTEPLFTVKRELCTHAHVTKGPGFRHCFEAGAPKDAVRNMGVPPVLVRGIRV